jgi:hypothetical protein
MSTYDLQYRIVSLCTLQLSTANDLQSLRPDATERTRAEELRSKVISPQQRDS